MPDITVPPSRHLPEIYQVFTANQARQSRFPAIVTPADDAAAPSGAGS